MHISITWLFGLIVEIEHTCMRQEGNLNNEPYCNPTQVGGCRTLRCYESKYAEGTRQNDPVTLG